MKYNKIALYLFLLLGVINLKFQCEKGPYETYEPNKYSFKEKVSLTPYNLDYRVGDTIWLAVNIPKKELFDEKTNTKVFFDSAQFASLLQINLLYNNPFITTGPFASFIFPAGIVANTNNGSGQTFAFITWGCSPSADYKLTIGIVLKEKGVFGIHFFNTNIQKCFSNKVINSSVTFSFDVNDPHKQFYQQLPFVNIGKQVDPYALEYLDKKSMVAINVQ